MASIRDPRLISALVKMEVADKCKLRTTQVAGSGSWIATVYEISTDKHMCTGRGADEEGCVRDAVEQFDPDKLTKTAKKLASENEDLRQRLDDLESDVATKPSKASAGKAGDNSAAPAAKRAKRVTKSPRSDFVIDPEQNISGK